MEDVQVRPDKMLLGATPRGKKIYYVRKPLKTIRFIAFGDGGQLPPMLEGGFSSCKAAQTAVDNYLAKMKKGDIDEAGFEVKINPKHKVVAQPKVKATPKVKVIAKSRAKTVE